MKILSLRHLGAWALNPKSWGEAVRRISAGRRGQHWCESVAVDVAAGLEQIGLESGVTEVASVHPDTFEASIERVRRCPHVLGGSSNLDLIYTICTQLGVKRVVETGVAYGWSSLALLLAIDGHPNARLWSTDQPYAFLDGDTDCVGVAVPGRLRDKWTLLRDSDRVALPVALAEVDQLDFAHYDSDKSAEGKRWALATIWSYLREGGVLMVDDVNDDLVFRDFCFHIEVEPIVVRDPVRSKYQGLARKENSQL